MGWRIWACWARRSHRGRCSYRGAPLVGAPVSGAKGATWVVGACSVRTGGGAPTGGASRFGFVGAPVAGAIWGGAFGRAGHAVRTGGGAPTGDDPWVVGAPAPGAKAVSLPHHSGQGISSAAITSPSHPTTSIFFPFLSLISAARFGGR